jgi:hypothetical protein
VWMAPTPDVQEMVIVVFRRKAGCWWVRCVLASPF